MLGHGAEAPNVPPGEGGPTVTGLTGVPRGAARCFPRRLVEWRSRLLIRFGRDSRGIRVRCERAATHGALTNHNRCGRPWRQGRSIRLSSGNVPGNLSRSFVWKVADRQANHATNGGANPPGARGDLERWRKPPMRRTLLAGCDGPGTVPTLKGQSGRNVRLPLVGQRTTMNHHAESWAGSAQAPDGWFGQAWGARWRVIRATLPPRQSLRCVRGFWRGAHRGPC